MILLVICVQFLALYIFALLLLLKENVHIKTHVIEFFSFFDPVRTGKQTQGRL